MQAYKAMPNTHMAWYMCIAGYTDVLEGHPDIVNQSDLEELAAISHEHRKPLVHRLHAMYTRAWLLWRRAERGQASMRYHATLRAARAAQPADRQVKLTVNRVDAAGNPGLYEVTSGVEVDRLIALIERNLAQRATPATRDPESAEECAAMRLRHKLDMANAVDGNIGRVREGNVKRQTFWPIAGPGYHAALNAALQARSDGCERCGELAADNKLKVCNRCELVWYCSKCVPNTRCAFVGCLTCRCTSMAYACQAVVKCN
jgi:hypothetical protein